MAEAYFNHLAAQQGLPFRAASAGTRGGGVLNPVAVEVMEADGVSMGAQRPKALTQVLVDSSRRVVSMGCGVDAATCPARFMVTEDWGLDDPAGQLIGVVSRIRDEIKAKVIRLIVEIEVAG